ncbi:hypothetical protein HJG60_011542 [Phyllostomus discolor]|uniref:Uncharacterized protein n=1 Tax=Phyllostomus discolor TaxID=89673 RepID=A0A833ZZ71_9CHIR|nr:hypothetical protein HJG60_011542 [Phyllostomus discolor]
MEAWRWDLARERPEALFRSSESSKCPQWQGQPHTVLPGSLSPTGPGNPGQRLGFPGAEQEEPYSQLSLAQPLWSIFPETFLTRETSGGLQTLPRAATLRWKQQQQLWRDCSGIVLFWSLLLESNRSR